MSKTRLTSKARLHAPVRDVSDGGVRRTTNAQLNEKKLFACGPQHPESVARTDFWKEGEYTHTLFADDAGRVYLRKTHATHREQWYRVPVMDVNRA